MPAKKEAGRSAVLQFRLEAFHGAAVAYVAELVRNKPHALGYAGKSKERLADQIAQLEPLTRKP